MGGLNLKTTITIDGKDVKIEILDMDYGMITGFIFNGDYFIRALDEKTTITQNINLMTVDKNNNEKKPLPVTIIEKVCSKCGKEKPLTEFTPSDKYKSGHISQCKECLSSYQREHYKDNIQKYAKEAELINTKFCSHCKKEKPLADFDKGTGSLGLQNTCKDCEHDKYTKKKKDAVERFFQKKLKKKQYLRKNLKIVFLIPRLV